MPLLLGRLRQVLPGAEPRIWVCIDGPRTESPLVNALVDELPAGFAVFEPLRMMLSSDVQLDLPKLTCFCELVRLPLVRAFELPLYGAPPVYVGLAV